MLIAGPAAVETFVIDPPPPGALVFAESKPVESDSTNGARCYRVSTV